MSKPQKSLNSKEKTIVCVFAKPPVAGTVKTRLMSVYGREPARDLARAFLEDTIRNLQQLAWAKIVIATTFPYGGDMASLVSGNKIIDQGDGDLGARIERVMGLLLKQSSRVFIMGADTPGLPPDRLESARRLLETHDGVIGPAEDGGFYLLGLKSCPPNLFQDIPWGGDNTYEKTTERLNAYGVSFAALEPWFDVDRPDDVKKLYELIRRRSVFAPASAGVIRRLALISESDMSRVSSTTKIDE